MNEKKDFIQKIFNFASGETVTKMAKYLKKVTYKLNEEILREGE